jgi:hypothetical protein
MIYLPSNVGYMHPIMSLRILFQLVSDGLGKIVHPVDPQGNTVVYIWQRCLTNKLRSVVGEGRFAVGVIQVGAALRLEILHSDFHDMAEYRRSYWSR